MPPQTCVWSAVHCKSDHKPLELMNLESLADASTHVQCMLLHLQGYKLTLNYCPGHKMLLPDALSLYAHEHSDEIKLNLSIHHMYVIPECKDSVQQAFSDCYFHI